MERQLALIDTSPQGQWRLDERTCEIGRRGIAAARAALAATAGPGEVEADDASPAEKRSAA